jgi:hypothetical protein
MIDSAFGTNGVKHTGLMLQGGSWFTSKSYHVAFFNSLGKIKFFDDRVVVAAPLMPKSAKLPISLITFKLDGTIDSAYGAVNHTNGIVTYAGLSAMDSGVTINYSNDGSLLLCGSQNGYGAVAKFFYGGVIDSTFGTNGIALLDRGFGTEHYSLIGFTGLGGNVGNKIFAGIGTINGGSSNSDFLLARYVPIQPLRVTPTSLVFGMVDSGKSRDLSFEITNFDSVTHTIDSVSVINPQYAILAPVRNVPLAPGAAITVGVRFAPTNTDSTMATVTIFDRMGVRNVALAGRGVAGSAGVYSESQPLFSITPNPAASFVSILGTDVIRYQIIDAVGRMVDASDRTSNTIDLSKLPAGMYFLDLTTTNGRGLRKLSIER